MVLRNITSLFGVIALIALLGACAGPMTQGESGGLSGMWHGSFVHPGADYTSPSNPTLTLRVNDDSTYTLKWGARAETTGTIAAQGNRVVLNDSSGTQITLMHSGDTLYAVMKDTATGRAATMNLVKDESVGTQAAGIRMRLCQAAGGSYSGGTCQAGIDEMAVHKQQCEARGGVFFAADYCEVPAGGLRPS
jgi:hypothetical protein